MAEGQVTATFLGVLAGGGLSDGSTPICPDIRSRAVPPEVGRGMPGPGPSSVSVIILSVPVTLMIIIK